ncbi:MAG: hypothetical protein IJR31_06145 [Lachnospiraceae bacterium]|nr:hypothetical protein [Lachnospiraceae bacterium]
MRPYSVEIFTPEFRYRDHTMINPAELKFYSDYLDPEKNTVEVFNTLKVELDDYIRIDGGKEQHFGIVKKLQDGSSHDKAMKSITYMDFVMLFDVDIAIDLRELAQGNFENYIARRITECYIDNPDTYQDIEGLEVSIASSTPEWSLDLTYEGRDEDHAVVNMLDQIILKAFSKYQIVLVFKPDVQHKKIQVSIRKNNEVSRTIEADLPNVLDKYVMVQKAKKMTNKVTIYNINDFTSMVIYYLHTDNTFSTTDEDRMLPVAFSTETVSTNTAAESTVNIVKELSSAKSKVSSLNKKDELDEKDREDMEAAVAKLNEYLDLGITIGAGGYAYYNGTKISDVTFIETAITSYEGSEENVSDGIALAAELFSEAAYKKAEDVFSKNAYENLIEIECMKDDTLINPMEMETGQAVSVISNGVAYQSILTGKKITDTARLIFGTIRLELTTQLKGRA